MCSSFFSIPEDQICKQSHIKTSELTWAATSALPLTLQQEQSQDFLQGDSQHHKFDSILSQMSLYIQHAVPILLF